MADLGAIGIEHTDIAVRVIPLSFVAGDGTARLLDDPKARVPFDIADAQIPKNFPRAFVQNDRRITMGRTALYLKDFREVRGTVKNSAGTGIVRRVLMTNAFGQCVGSVVSAADGTFKCLVDNQVGYVLAEALPDDVDNRNAVVKWKITPVAAL